jgi:hypothetical protein
MGAYEKDFYAWTIEQASLLRAGKLHEIDLEHVAEEIESLGRSEKRELINRLAVLLAHLLKWHAQPALRSKSWTFTIQELRRRLELLLDDNPSLSAIIPDSFGKAYQVGVLQALKDTNFDQDAFPASSPWAPEQVLDRTFYPE